MANNEPAYQPLPEQPETPFERAALEHPSGFEPAAVNDNAHTLVDILLDAGGDDHLTAARQRWRRGAAKVMEANDACGHQPGTVQGIDVKRLPEHITHWVSKLTQEVNITIADYSSARAEIYRDLNNNTLQSFLSRQRPAWAKVRWINVDSISWDVIQALALKYDLHPLAVEDILHIPQRIKADFYENFVYVSLTMAFVEKRQAHEPCSGPTCGVPLSTASAPSALHAPRRSTTLVRQPSGLAVDMNSHTRSGSMSDGATTRRRLLNSMSQPTSSFSSGRNMFRTHRPAPCAASQQHQQHQQWQRQLQQAPQQLSGAGEAFQVASAQASLLLIKDGTVISFFECNGHKVSEPILHQLLEGKTLARDSEDASYLLNLLVDAVVDLCYPVVDTYIELLETFETKVLQDTPAASITKELHVMQGDLNQFKRTILPTYNTVAALRGHMDSDKQLVSQLTRMYLNDVQDHLSTILENMDTLSAQCRDLIDLVFNLIAHGTNKSMQTLSVVSTIFLPITFLAGVYGTNFDYLPELHWHYGYAGFWGVCALITVLFVILLARLGMLSSQ